jgi:hypothetical protein
MEAELNKRWDEFKEFMADKDFGQSCYFYWGVKGTDNPVLWSAARAKNVTEFWEGNAKMWKVFGEDAGKLKQKLMKYVTKEEQKMAWHQKDLSPSSAKNEE